MDITQAMDFLETHHRCVFMTTRDDGRAQLSPVVAAVDSSGRVIVSTREHSAKATNLRKRPWAALCVLTDEFFGPWVQIEGPCEIVSLPDAMDGLVEYYRRVSGEHPNWDEYCQAMTAEQRVLVHIEPSRVSPR